MNLVEELKAIAKDLGITVAQLSIARVLRWPGVTSAIVGARNPDQLAETVQAANVSLPESVVSEIQHIMESV